LRDAPGSSVVSRDGAPLAASSLGVPLAMAPGLHTLSVVAPGRAERTFFVTLAEGTAQSVEVAPGPSVQMPTVVTREIPAPRSDSGLGSSKLLALGVGGTGVIGLAVGGISGLVAVSKHDALSAQCRLGGGACPPDAQGDLDSFRSLRTVSTVCYVVGGLGLVAGAVLWILPPKSSKDRDAMGLVIGPGSAHIGGTF
jgi:hypothetical protein